MNHLAILVTSCLGEHKMVHLWEPMESDMSVFAAFKIQTKFQKNYLKVHIMIYYPNFQNGIKIYIILAGRPGGDRWAEARARE